MARENRELKVETKRVEGRKSAKSRLLGGIYETEHLIKTESIAHSGA